MHRFIIFFSLNLVLWCLSASAQVNTFARTLKENYSAPRWMFEKTETPPSKGIASHLYKMKWAQLNNKFSLCLSRGETVLKLAKSLEPWIRKNQLDCVLQWAESEKAGVQAISRLTRVVDQHQHWIYTGAHHESLLKNYIKGLLRILQEQTRSSRNEAWKTIGKLQSIESRLSSDQVAEVYKRAGELAFIEQQLLASFQFFLRSLDEKEQRDLRERLESIRAAIPGLKKSDPIVGKGPSEEEVNVEYSEDERKLYERMKRSVVSKDLVSVVEDGVSLITDFPGSQKAEWAEKKILSIYLGVANNSDKKFTLIRKKILRLMRQADAQRLFRWARNASARGAYYDALTLAEEVLDKLGPHPSAKEVLDLAAQSAVSAGEYASAEKHLKRLAEKHAGSNEAREALFRLGLLNFRQKDYSQASAFFERLLAILGKDEFRPHALYWNWRSYQRLNREGAIEIAQELIRRYPLTYYGLRARAELNSGILNWPEENGSSSVEATFSFTDQENQTYERLQILLAAGWFEEAQEEIKELPEPQTPEQMVLHAKLWASAFNHFHSITWMNRAWDLNENLRTLASVKTIFPVEFSSFVNEQSKTYEINKNLILGLIRQESSFRAKAISPANAMGLMQLVPLTAGDVARFLRWKKPLQIPEDLFVPQTNIEFGTSYLSRMLKAFDGHLPLALAAYNAGIGRVRRWMNSRPDLGVEEKKLDSSPENEVWIDEIPWPETRHYVKSVIRNFLIYEMLESKEVLLSNPVWSPTVDKVKSKNANR